MKVQPCSESMQPDGDEYLNPIMTVLAVMLGAAM